MNLDVSLVDNTAPSAGKLISKIMKSLRIPYSKSIANNLLLALNGDTGGFQYSQRSGDFFYAGYLIKKGANNQEVFEASSYKSEAAKALLLLALQKAESRIVNNHRLVYSHTTDTEMKEINAKSTDIQNISSALRDSYSNQDQTKSKLPILAVHMTELIDPKSYKIQIKVSIRPYRDSSINAAELVKDFNGGGHKEAAGFNIAREKSLTLEENFQKIINSIAEQIPNS